MSLAIFYDTETTGLPLFSEPSEHPDQPHIVQLAACLVDMESRLTVASLNLTVRPDGWTIPDEVAAIHGITTERALEIGVPEDEALAIFMRMWSGRVRIGHNESFDARIVRIAQHRFGYSDVVLADWKAGRAECTARLSKPIVKCPPTAKMRAAGRNHHKTPTLSEAYEYFMGKPLADAHSAMADVQGCMDVYFAVKDLES